MANKEIREELRAHNIEDNPFDVMMHKSMELVRSLLFTCVRYRNPDCPDSIKTSRKDLEYYMNEILDSFDTLEQMSDETATLCRNTSYYCYTDTNNFNELNEFLLRAERSMETVWSRCVPNRNDDFEKVRLGEDSPEYKRLLELRKIADDSTEDNDYWCNLIGVIDRPDECIEYGWISEEELKAKQEVIKKFNLTTDDIHYIIAYKFKK